MKKIKNLAKNLYGKTKCYLNNIDSPKNIFMGYPIKIFNKGKIILGEDVLIGPNTRLYTHKPNTSKIIIGNGVQIGIQNTITVINEVVLEDYVMGA
jgi:acetyltransferase-like isoleucine patch superfamily enzyme